MARHPNSVTYSNTWGGAPAPPFRTSSIPPFSGGSAPRSLHPPQWPCYGGRVARRLRSATQIRDERLYREEFDNFEGYCREKWQCGRDYVDRLISAAQVFKHLLTNCQQPQPQYETQVRPLIGLSPEQTQAAWKRAVETAGGRKITARQVKAAMQDLQLAPKVPTPVTKPFREPHRTASLDQR